MIDSRTVVFPMTAGDLAGDLVQSACIVGCDKRGDGVEMRLLEVLDIKRPVDGDSLVVFVRDRVTLERGELVLNAGTPILIAEISRT